MRVRVLGSVSLAGVSASVAGSGGGESVAGSGGGAQPSTCSATQLNIRNWDFSKFAFGRAARGSTISALSEYLRIYNVS